MQLYFDGEVQWTAENFLEALTLATVMRGVSGGLRFRKGPNGVQAHPQNTPTSSVSSMTTVVTQALRTSPTWQQASQSVQNLFVNMLKV